MSRPLADDEGRPSEQSSFWRRLKELFPDAAHHTVLATGRSSAAEIATPRQLVTSLMRWVRSSADPVGTLLEPTWPALYHWLAQHTCCNDAIDNIRYRAWRALSYANPASLSPEVAKELFPSPLRATVAQLETFATCPFQHFARFTLGLRARDRQEVTGQDLGRIYH